MSGEVERSWGTLPIATKYVNNQGQRQCMQEERYAGLACRKRLAGMQA